MTLPGIRGGRIMRLASVPEEEAAVQPAGGKDRRMRALQFSEYGSPEVLRWEEAPEPHAGPGQIRIEVRAASVNPVDWKVLSGAMSGGQPLSGRGYVGSDAAGVVDEVGDGVAGVSVGDEVFGGGQSTQAEYAVLDSWALKPASVDWAVVAAVAWRARPLSAACDCSGSRLATPSSSTAVRVVWERSRCRWRMRVARG